MFIRFTVDIENEWLILGRFGVLCKIFDSWPPEANIYRTRSFFTCVWD